MKYFRKMDYMKQAWGVNVIAWVLMNIAVCLILLLKMIRSHHVPPRWHSSGLAEREIFDHYTEVHYYSFPIT